MGESVRQVTWVRVLRAAVDERHATVQYALEITAIPGGARRVGYALFCPAGVADRDSGDCESWNSKVGRAWLEAFNSQEAKAWIARVHRLCTDILDRLLNIESAHRSGGW